MSRVPREDVDIGRCKMCHIKMYYRDSMKEKEKSMHSQKEGTEIDALDAFLIRCT